MTDFFALLELPRSPWLEAAAVKERFATKSGPVHPDRVHQADAATRTAATQRYAEFNAAQQCLADTRQRLRHLIELETGRPPSDLGAVPPHISELFFKVGQSLRSADELVRQKQAATSPMVQAQVMRLAMDRMEALREVIGELEQRRSRLDDRCRTLGANRAVGEDFLPILTELHRDYSYLNRWIEQLRERLLQLTL
jgi:chemotaxis protein histidine kinase CheA